MVSSTAEQQPNAAISEEELARLTRTRVTLRKASELIDRSYQSTRTLVKNRHLIALQVGGVKMVTLYEIRRFLSRGNATELDWQQNEERTRQ